MRISCHKVDVVHYAAYPVCMTHNLREYSPPDPAIMGYPATFPLEIALKTAPLQTICEAYGIDRDTWEELRVSPRFVADITEAVELVKKEGAGFKLKARMQSDALLATSWKMIHAPLDQVPSSVKADLIKSTIRWAGLEPEKTPAAGGQAGSTLQIQINL
jgi:hypothetical protein